MLPEQIIDKETDIQYDNNNNNSFDLHLVRKHIKMFKWL